MWFLVVLCQEEKMQVESGSGNFRQILVGLVWVESGNVNKKYLNVLLRTLFHASKSADWINVRLQTNPQAVNRCLENKMKARFGLSMP